MIRTFSLTLFLLFGLGSLMVVGATVIQRAPLVADAASLQSVDASVKGDRLQAAHADVASMDNANTDAAPGLAALRKAAHDIKVAQQLAPLIFAPPAGDDAPLMPVPGAQQDVADNTAAAADTTETGAPDAKKSWRDANAQASVGETEPRKTARAVSRHKPRIRVARAKPAAEAPAPDVKTCVQPTGFNGFLASLNLKPRCAT